MINNFKAKKWLYKYQEASEKLLDALTTVCIDFLVGQARAGAQVLQVFESHADALSPELFHKFTLKLLKRIATEVKAKLGKKLSKYYTKLPKIFLGKDSPPVSIFCKGGHFMNKEFVKSEVI